MAQGSLTIFNEAKKWLADGTFDLDAAATEYSVALIDNTTVPTATTANPILGTFTELTASGNYVGGGFPLTNLSFTETATNSGIWELDSTDSPNWAQDAVNNPSNAYYAVLYREGTQNGKLNPCLCFIDLGGVVDMKLGDLTINFNANGILRLA